MKNTMYKPIPVRQKQIMSLRLSYLGGYTLYFAEQARRMMKMGFTIAELVESSVDDKMKEWVKRLNLEECKTREK